MAAIRQQRDVAEQRQGRAARSPQSLSAKTQSRWHTQQHEHHAQDQRPTNPPLARSANRRGPRSTRPRPQEQQQQRPASATPGAGPTTPPLRGRRRGAGGDAQSDGRRNLRPEGKIGRRGGRAGPRARRPRRHAPRPAATPRPPIRPPRHGGCTPSWPTTRRSPPNAPPAGAPRRRSAALRTERAEPPPPPRPTPQTVRQAAPVVERVEPLLERPVRKPRAPAAPKDAKPVRWWTPSYRAKKV